MVEQKKAFVVTLNGDFEIDFVHQIEKEVDCAVGKLGFTREMTRHLENSVVIEYRQFARAL